MKRSILVLLAAVALNIGVVGSAPAQAATPDSYSPATVVTPQHHRHHRDDWWHDGHRHHHHDDWWDDDDHEHHDGHDRRCEGLVVVCHLLF
ncbi:MAG TPA: hypothetical protein VFE55_16530 [Acidimicrobiia bacterium]|nr:hypothetical protein [Acidimicrobiia bacterium]